MKDVGMIEELRLGARYPSFRALEAAVEKFSKETNSVYIVNHSRSVELENKCRPANKQIPKCLKYKNIKFACKHYGKARTNSRGLRPNQSSFKIGCPSFIYVSANTKELVVEKIETSHSHSCDPELVSLYPERRSLAHARRGDESDDGSGPSLKSTREDVLDLLQIGVERRRILNYIWVTVGRQLFPTDLANLAKELKDHPREVSPERRSTLLSNLKAMESKQNGTTYKPLAKQIGLRAVKKENPVPTAAESVIKTEVISNEDSSDQCYSVMETEQGEQYDNSVYIIDSLDLPEGEAIHYQEDPSSAGGTEETSAAWNENSSLADVVKSILGPNQEGRVILHVNDYDGVAVVQIADPESFDTTEAGEEDLALGTSQSEGRGGETSVPPTEQPSMSRLVVKKTQAPKKPLVVTAFPSGTSKTVPESGLLKAAQLKRPNYYSACEEPPEKTESCDDHLSDGGTQDDLSDTNSDRRSVLEDERMMYRVKTKKIRLQIENLKNSIERQELEKKKLQLEVKLLKFQVDEKETQVKSKPLTDKRRQPQ